MTKAIVIFGTIFTLFLLHIRLLPNSVSECVCSSKNQSVYFLYLLFLNLCFSLPILNNLVSTPFRKAYHTASSLRVWAAWWRPRRAATAPPATRNTECSDRVRSACTLPTRVSGGGVFLSRTYRSSTTRNSLYSRLSASVCSTAMLPWSRRYPMLLGCSVD